MKMDLGAMKRAISAAWQTHAGGFSARKKIVAATALAGVVFFGGTYWAAGSTERTFRNSAEEMSKFGTKVTVLDYQRGFFGATARTEWVLSRAGEDQVTFFFDHSIRHGPVLSFASAASIRSELALPEELIASLGESLSGDPFEGKAPLTVESVFGLGGGVRGRVVSPRLEISSGDANLAGAGSARLVWGGLEGKFSVSSDGSKVKAQVVMDGVSVAEGTQDQPGMGQIEIGRVTFLTDMAKPSGHETLFAGTSSLVADRLSFRETVKSGSDSARAFAVENLRGKTDTAVRYGALTVDIRLDADTFALGGQQQITLEKPGAAFVYENLDVHALEALSRAAQNAQDQSGQELQDTVQVIQRQFKTLLGRKPVFSVRGLTAGTPEGTVKGDFRMAYAGSGDPALLSPADLALDVQFSLPVALITRLLEEHASKGAAESIQAQRQAASINSLIDKGVLAEKDGVLGVEASFKDNALILNGKAESVDVLRGVF